MSKKESNKDYIYVVLVKSMTGLGNFARIFSKYEYTHIAICLNDKLNDFISFSRRRHHAPFDSGFMRETMDCLCIGDDKVKLKVFKVPVTKDNKEKIIKYIDKIENDKDYIFNLYSMATMAIIHGFRIYKTHNCMTFVSKILEMSKVVPMNKKYYKYNIKDIDILLFDFLYKEEYFYKKKIENEHYFDKVCFLKNILMFFKINGRLLYRMLFKFRKIRDDQ